MRKYLILFLFLFGIGAVWWSLDKIFNLTLPKESSFSPSPALPSFIDESSYKKNLEKMGKIEIDEKSYRFAWLKIDELEKIKLFSNCETKKTAKDLKKEKTCRFLVNGGFYSKKDEPLGWLVSEVNLISPKIQSDLLDGFLTIDKDRVSIDSFYPGNQVRVGLQSGPLLIEKSQPLVLKILEDQETRRIVAGINQQDELLFMAVVGEDSSLNGPLLSDLPVLVKNIGIEIDEPIKAALNLDGGSHSVFLSEEIELSEVSLIGSYFCLE